MRGWRPAGRRWNRVALDLVFPSSCFACGRALIGAQHLGACLACWTDLSVLRAPLCSTCGLPRPPGTDLLGPAMGRCASCIVAPLPLSVVRCAVEYDESARRFLLRAKLGRRPELLHTLGRQLALLVRNSGLASGCSAVVPVPSHPWANLRRGFSPARELARPVARAVGLPLSGRLLRRRLSSRSSTKRLGAARRRLAGLDSVRVGRQLGGERLLLVDDVMTTGATTSACCAALLEAGALEVRAAIWARTL